MTSARQYVTCKFPGGAREYTYHSDLPRQLQVGDLVTVTTPAGSEQEVEVTGILFEPPSFPTKPCYM